MVQFLPAQQTGLQAGLAGLSQGFGQGLDFVSRSRQQAMQQQQMDLQQKAQERLQQQAETEKEANKIGALVNIAKIKDPKTRKAAFAYIAPQLGFDQESPGYKGFLDLLGTEDPELTKAFNQAASELKLGPGMTQMFAKTVQEDPSGTLNQLLSFARNRSEAEARSQALALGQQRTELSGERLDLQNKTLQERLAGNLTPERLVPLTTQQQDPNNPENIISQKQILSVKPGMGNNPSVATPLTAPVTSGLKIPSLPRNPNEAASVKNAQQGLGRLDDVFNGLVGPDGVNLKNLATFDATATSAGASGIVGGAVGGVVNRALGSSEGAGLYSKWVQAIQDYQHSKYGSQQTAGEISRLYGAFRPQIGDSAERLKQKNEALKQQLGNIIPPGLAGSEGPPTLPQGQPQAAPQAPQRRMLPPQAEAQLRILGQKYRSGQITTAELNQLKAILKAKGFDLNE